MKTLIIALCLTACTTSTLKKDVAKVETAATKVIDCVTGKTQAPLCQMATVLAKWLAAPVMREESTVQPVNVADLGAAFRAANTDGAVYHTMYGNVH